MKHYKFIPFSEYNETVPSTDEEGNPIEEHVSPFWFSNPHARVSHDQTEVVLSLSPEVPDETLLDRDAAAAHIANNWNEPEGEPQ
jgi:hypothetical protein